MADYPELKLTNKGIALLGKVTAGVTKLTFTRFGMGSGSFYYPGDVPGMTALVNEKLSRAVEESKPLDNENVQVGTTITNEHLPTSEFKMSEIGLFAMDPDDGEILYGVTYPGTTGDTLPAKATKMVFDYAVNIVVTIADSANVTVIVNSALAATKEDVSDHAALIVDPTKIGNTAKHLTDNQAKSWEDHGNDGGKHVTQAQKDSWDNHPENVVIHVTQAEKDKWNSMRGLPVGVELLWGSETLPPVEYGIWMEQDGSAFDKDVYPELYAHLGNSNVLPEVRGEGVRGWDHGRGIDPGREINSFQADAIQNIVGHFGNVSPCAASGIGSSGTFFTSGGGAKYPTSWSIASMDHDNVHFDASRVVRTGPQTVMRNIAKMVLIKAR